MLLCEPSVDVFLLVPCGRGYTQATPIIEDKPSSHLYMQPWHA